jgi:hypothetical protein
MSEWEVKSESGPAMTMMVGREEANAEVRYMYVGARWGRQMRYLEVVTTMDRIPTMEILWAKQLLPANAFMIGVTREQVIQGTGRGDDGRDIPQAIILQEMDGATEMLTMLTGSGIEERRRYERTPPMARSLINVQMREPSEQWLEWTLRREGMFHKWLKDLPAPEGEEIVMQMVLLTIEDPMETGDRVKQMARQIVGSDSLRLNVMAIGMEWLNSFTHWTVSQNRRMPSRTVVDRWLKKIKEEVAKSDAILRGQKEMAEQRKKDEEERRERQKLAQEEERKRKEKVEEEETERRKRREMEEKELREEEERRELHKMLAQVEREQKEEEARRVRQQRLKEEEDRKKKKDEDDRREKQMREEQEKEEEARRVRQRLKEEEDRKKKEDEDEEASREKKKLQEQVEKERR